MLMVLKADGVGVGGIAVRSGSEVVGVGGIAVRSGSEVVGSVEMRKHVFHDKKQFVSWKHM